MFYFYMVVNAGVVMPKKSRAQVLVDFRTDIRR